MAAISSSRLILAAVMAIFVYGVIAAILGVLMPKFGLTEEQNGNIALAQAIGLIIASLSAGPLIDNKGKKTALVLGLAVIAVALFLIPNFIGGYGALMACLLLLGLGGGIIVTAGNALASDINEER